MNTSKASGAVQETVMNPTSEKFKIIGASSTRGLAGRGAAIARIQCQLWFLCLLIVSVPCWSATINVTDPHPKYFDSAVNCPPNYPACYDRAYLQTAPINALNHGFDASFDAWNSQFGNNQWSITNGGFLDAEFDVTKFTATIDPSKLIGGVEIRILFNYAGADKADFYWAQGDYSNYTTAGMNIVKPYFEMDVVAAGCDNTDLQKQCPPLYAYQYGDRHFYDFPEGPFPNGFFNGYAYPVKIDRVHDTLTVYQGVAYGFQLSEAPEPCTLFLTGSGVLFVIRRRHKRLRA